MKTSPLEGVSIVLCRWFESFLRRLFHTWLVFSCLLIHRKTHRAIALMYRLILGPMISIKEKFLWSYREIWRQNLIYVFEKMLTLKVTPWLIFIIVIIITKIHYVKLKNILKCPNQNKMWKHYKFLISESFSAVIWLEVYQAYEKDLWKLSQKQWARNPFSARIMYIGRIATIVRYSIRDILSIKFCSFKRLSIRFFLSLSG